MTVVSVVIKFNLSLSAVKLKQIDFCVSSWSVFSDGQLHVSRRFCPHTDLRSSTTGNLSSQVWGEAAQYVCVRVCERASVCVRVCACMRVVWACVWLWVNVCICVWLCICDCVYIQMCVYVYMCIWECAYVTCVYENVYMWVCVYVCVYIYICVCMCVCVCVSVVDTRT